MKNVCFTSICYRRKQKNLMRNKWFYFVLAPSYCCACFKCCFEDLLLTIPIPGGGDVECFLSILMIVNSPFVFPPGARGHGHSFFQTLSFFPVGKKLQLHRSSEWVGLLPAFSNRFSAFAHTPRHPQQEMSVYVHVVQSLHSSKMLTWTGNWSGSGQAPKAVG